jgi:hypothetical protein
MDHPPPMSHHEVYHSHPSRHCLLGRKGRRSAKRTMDFPSRCPCQNPFFPERPSTKGHHCSVCWQSAIQYQDQPPIAQQSLHAGHSESPLTVMHIVSDHRRHGIWAGYYSTNPPKFNLGSSLGRSFFLWVGFGYEGNTTLWPKNTRSSPN